MALYWLTARDGSVNFKCQAQDAGQAFELCARSLRYNSFAAFSADLGYTPGDFQVATIEVEHREVDTDGNRRELKRQEDSITTTAFKVLRRLTR